MSILSEISEYWRNRIERDLAAFADPGAEVEITGTLGRLDATWYSRTVRREARFRLSPEAVTVTFSGKNLLYSSFLASPEMADLQGIAKMILQSSGTQFYVSAPARRVVKDSYSGDEVKPNSGVEILSKLLSNEPSNGRTRIVFVTGDAGTGKTSLLKELVRRQSDAYLRGKTNHLLLYVDAQGRALARFNEALATELQDLRANMTYHAVGALTRAGILVPVIDGFDELLGVSGYDDAFSSLASFVEELDGLGQIIASARSTYYEEEFVARAGSASSLGSQSWEEEVIDVLSWEREQIEAYVDLRLRGRPSDEVERLKKQLRQSFGKRNEALAEKPFFVAKTLELIESNRNLEADGDLLEQLADAYLERERTEKLLDRRGVPLLSDGQMKLVMKTVAREMWAQNTRELTKRDIREIAELVAISEELGRVAQDALVERLPTLAFLHVAERAGHIAFEHEMFFSYFLTLSLVELWSASVLPLRSMLGRAALPSSVGERLAASLLAQGESPASVAKRLGTVSSSMEDSRGTQVQENCGQILLGILNEVVEQGMSCIESVEIVATIFAGGKFPKMEIRASSLRGVTFRRVDISLLRFVECVGENVLFHEVTVAPEVTLLQIAGIDPDASFSGLRNYEKIVYDPIEIREILQRCGVALPNVAHIWRVSADMRDLLERLMRHYGEANPVCVEDDRHQRIFQDPAWSKLERLLLKHGIVIQETRPTKDRRKKFLRRQYLPDQIMAGANQRTRVAHAIGAFWQELAELYPSQ